MLSIAIETKTEIMKQVETVKCYYDDVIYCVGFRDNKGNITSYNDMSGAKWHESDFTKSYQL